MKSLGEKYLDELDLEVAENFKDLSRLLSKKIGPGEADAIIRMIDQRADTVVSLIGLR